MLEQYNKIYVGIVKDNEDYHNMGRLGVLIPELSNIKDNNIIVSYASPFIGSSDPNDNDQNETHTFEGTQVSYGFWAVPPTINSLVLVAFANAEPSRGYWFACIQQQYMNHMLPNIPVGESFQFEDGEDNLVPVAEYNKYDNAPNKHNSKRPYHKTHYEAIRNQGLRKDKVRGFSQHGATSKKPSSVMGLLSPKGHYWSVEDTDNDEKIRLRTKSGVQLLLDDTNGLVYVINKNGSGWVEVGATGKIMVYGEDGIALRTKQDFSIRADRDIIMESGRNVYINSNRDILTESKNFLNTTTAKFVIFSDDDISIAGKELNVDMSSSANFLVGNEFNLGCNDKLSINANKDVAIGGKAIDINASGSLTMSSSATASLSSKSSLVMVSNASTVLKGSTVSMNIGGSFIGAKAATPTQASVIQPLKFDKFDKEDIFQPSSEDEPQVTILKTVVTTLPTHEPCPEHDLDPEDRN